MKKLLLISFLFVSSAHAEDVNPAVIANISARMTALEEQNRQLTGRIEELEYQSKQIEAKLEAAATAPAPVPEPIAESTPAPTSENPYVTKVGDENPTYVTKPEPEEPNLMMENDFDNAFTYVASEDYAKAKPALTEFIKKYPQTDLAGEAYFWMGEVAWSQKDYTNAALNYLKGYKEAPTGGKASENILKMALTLNQLGKKDEACKYVQRFETEFPDSHPSLKAKSSQAKTSIGCK